MCVYTYSIHVYIYIIYTKISKIIYNNDLVSLWFVFLIPENAETKIPFSRDCSNMPVEIPNPKDEQEEEEEEEEAACVARGRSFESFRNIFFLFFFGGRRRKGTIHG